MTNLSREILDNWQVRKNKAQKSAFIDFIQSHIPEAKVEKKGSTRNIVVGDVDSAKVIYTAHYDTCAVMPLPNFIAPKNILFYILYQLFIVAVFFAIGIGVGYVVYTLAGGSFYMGYYATFAVVWLLLFLILAGPANPHTANDNTSGVITLCEIYAAMSPEQREKCAFVFFDMEELGLVGSSAFWRKHKKNLKNTLLINFDCVSDGDHIMLVSKKKAMKEYGDALEGAFLPHGEKAVLFEKSSTAFYPSDQSHFPCGVGVAALKRAPIVGYYMNRIHTPRDMIFDEENITLLCSGAVKLAEKL